MALPFQKRWIGRLLRLLLGWFWIGLRVAEGAGNEVLVIYNSQSPDSEAVARHYARRRSVPESQLLGLRLPQTATLSRADYVSAIQEPLRRHLVAKGLAEWVPDSSPLPPGRKASAQKRLRLVRSEIRYLLLCYGVPWYIPQDPSLRSDTQGIPPQLQRNDASVDDELALLPRLGFDDPIATAPNPVVGATNGAQIHPTNGVFMVTRLDGPTPEIARGLVDKALEAESLGLWGHAYIDLRAITNGPYGLGDRMITNAAVAAKRLGFETFVDNQPATLGVGYPLSQVALYVGWYDSGVTGPFYRASVEFQPGAFAYHLHSFSAANLRSASENWVGPLLARGATATMGCVAEPYLEFTPNPAMFLERWGYVGMTLGEAATAAHPVLSWQTVVVGDPLYRPFGRSLAEDGKRLDDANDPRTAYALVRNANLQLMAGRSVEAVRDQLEGQRWATLHAVVAEKIARLYWSGIRVRRALEWYDTALGLTNATPMQRRRLLQDSVEAHRVLGQPAEAYRCLEQLIVTAPPDVDLQELRIRQLQFAREMRDVEKVTAVSNEVQRLSGKR
jgi:uncharacterized protein (TIGR03790 family)